MQTALADQRTVSSTCNATRALDLQQQVQRLEHELEHANHELAVERSVNEEMSAIVGQLRDADAVSCSAETAKAPAPHCMPDEMHNDLVQAADSD